MAETHPQVWRTRLTYLIYSGRPAEALELLRNVSQRPPGTPDALVEFLDSTSTALSGQGPVTDAVARGLAYLKTKPAAAFSVVHACTALGDLDLSFALLDGYYFGAGKWSMLARRDGHNCLMGLLRAAGTLYQRRRGG